MATDFSTELLDYRGFTTFSLSNSESPVSAISSLCILRPATSVAFLSCLFLFAQIVTVPAADQDTRKPLKIKLFEQDIQTCRAFTKEQTTRISKFLDTLTEDDIKAIKAKWPGNATIINDEAISAYKALEDVKGWEISKLPKGLVYYNSSVGVDFPMNLLNETIYNVCKYDRLLALYEIPGDNQREALEKYAEYSAELLDKIQVLMSKAEKCSWPLYGFCNLNGVSNPSSTTGIGALSFLLTSENRKGDPRTTWAYVIYDNWNSATSKLPILYSIPTVLKTQKLWLEFLISNNLTMHKQRDEEIEIMSEIEKIEKRLAALSNTAAPGSKAGVGKTDSTQTTTGTDGEKLPTKKFKLDLPE